MKNDIINKLKTTDLLVNHSAKQRMIVDTKGNLIAHGFRLSPFYYSTVVIPWHLILTFHYKGHEYNLDNEAAESNRNDVIADLFGATKRKLGLNSRDLQYWGVTEKQNGRCHTHTQAHIRENAGKIAPLVRDTLLELIPWDIVSVPEKSQREKAVQIVERPEAVAAYLSKLNKNDMEIPKFHHSRDFIRFANRFVKPTLQENHHLKAHETQSADLLPF